MKELIPDKISKLEEQLKHVQENGNTEAAQKIEARIDRYKKIDQMIERARSLLMKQLMQSSIPKDIHRNCLRKIHLRKVIRPGWKVQL